MNFSTVSSLANRKRAELLVLPFWKGKNGAEYAADFKEFYAHLAGPLKTQDFNGKEGEVLILYVDSDKEPRIALLGLGEKEKLTVEKFRRSYSNLVKACRPKKIKDLNVLFPTNLNLPETAAFRGIVEGLLLTNYAFDKLKSKPLKEDAVALLHKVTFIGGGKKVLGLAEKYRTIAEGVYLARDLVNGNADVITPQFLAQLAKEWSSKLAHVKTTIFDKKRLEKEKMGLLLAVARASKVDPALIMMEYKGNPKSNEKTVLIGKGVTYDTGGLNLKPTGSMETMKCDMGGAAAVFGAFFVAAKLGLKINLAVLVPSTENCIGSASYKPGDVYTSYAGKTIEIGNTDAEGRLILADALAYAVEHLKPSRMIDIATLTGAMEVTLGAETTGLLSNNDALADSLMSAGSETFERVWRLPLFEEYRDQLKSEIADLKNIGGRSAGSITAALFLQEFVGKTPWAHLDIAGTAFISESRRYHPKHATGIGVRLLVEYLETL